MGYIKIETVTCSNERFAFEIESDGLYRINCLSGAVVESLDKICEICIIRDILVLRTEDRDFRNSFKHVPFLKDNRSENNILAFDLHGNFQWNIGSIVGDIKMAFSSVSCISKADAERKFGILIQSDTEMLLMCIAGGFIFLIDAINQRLVYKLAGKVK